MRQARQARQAMTEPGGRPSGLGALHGASRKRKGPPSPTRQGFPVWLAPSAQWLTAGSSLGSAVQESGCDRSVSHRVWHFAATNARCTRERQSPRALPNQRRLFRWVLLFCLYRPLPCPRTSTQPNRALVAQARFATPRLFLSHHPLPITPWWLARTR